MTRRKIDPAEPIDRIADVTRAVRATVVETAPTLRTETKWGHEWRVGRDLVLAVLPFSKHVGIEFWRGTSLPDPDGLLEGTGKNLRHAKIRSVASAESAPLRRLIRAAVALDRATTPRSRVRSRGPGSGAGGPTASS